MHRILSQWLIILIWLNELCTCYNNFNELKQDMESRVTRIATAFQKIHAQPCQNGTFTCPVKSFNICSGTDQRSCITQFPTTIQCQGVSRYSMTSGVRFPNSVASFNLSNEMKFFFCKTAEHQMQQVFQQLIAQNGKRYAWTGIGSSTGGYRVSPGFKYQKEKTTESCQNYDPRLRPWYSSNVFQRKKMVIIVQNSKPIHQQPNRYPSIQKSLKALLKTADPSDLFNVIQFSDSPRALIGGQALRLVSLTDSIKKYQNYTNGNGDYYDSLAQNITKSNSSEANYKKAVQLAIQILQNSKSSNPQMQNLIIMLTGFKPTNWSNVYTKQVSALITQKQEQLDLNFLFFGFGVNPGDKECIQFLTSMACSFEGIYIELSDITYQSMFVDQAEGFYQYLIQGNTVQGCRWTQLYNDAFGLGDMVTVLKPAYKIEHNVTRFLGFAAMDVLISQLKVYKTLEQIEQQLSTTQIPFKKRISTCALETIRRKYKCLDPTTSQCPNLTFCQHNIDPLVPIIRASQDTSNVLCCVFEEHNSTGLIVGLSVGISSGLLLIGILVYCFIFRNKQKHHLDKTYTQIFQKHKDFDKTRIRSQSQISLIKD